jgi:hypothetical protein
MIDAWVTVQSDDRDPEPWGRYRFAYLPAKGDRFSIWRDLELHSLEVRYVNQHPVPVTPSETHEPTWPVRHGDPEAYVITRLVERL